MLKAHVNVILQEKKTSFKKNSKHLQDQTLD